MTDIQKIKDYLLKNPEFLTGNYKQVAERFGVTYDSVRGIVRKLKEKQSLIDREQTVETSDGYKGILIGGTIWNNGKDELRALRFKVDDSQYWNNFKTSFINDIKEISPIIPKTKNINLGDNILEISLPDLHFGKGNTDELIFNFNKSIDELLYKASVYKISKIILPIGNDGMNSEGMRRTTTAGTPQVDTLSWQDSFRLYWITLVKGIERISETCPIDVIVVTGNHDTERMFYLGDVISAYFTNNKNITVNNNGEYRKYYEYGVNMLLFTHGDKEKTSDLPLIMATERPEMFARTKYREVHLGHFHKEMSNEYRGIKVKFLPSICTTDDWHKMKGYDHFKCAQAFLYNKYYGLQATYQINIF